MEYPDLTYYKNDDKIEISKLLKHLDLYKFYEKIDNEFNKKDESIHCKECNEKLNAITNQESELLELCKRVCNFILNNVNFKFFCIDSSCNSSCTHMKFRLYDHVMKIDEYNDNVKNFYEALESISKKTESKLRDCRFVNFELSKNKFMHYKYLYEFLINYTDIEDKITNEDSNAQLYCKHIKNFFRFYNTIKDSCTYENNCKYYNELTNLRKQFMEHGQINNIYDKCKYVKTPCENGTDVPNDIPCLTENGDGSTVQILGDDPNDNNFTNILFKVLIYLIPILTTFTLPYKFTPLGSLIRSRMNKRKNMLEHVYENNYDHLGNISKDEIPNSDSRDYNVLYQSDKNI
ncbi:unnamed protein product [Plasmodium vivax]|uniref:(malaria parasite P. vivax) hypothetical protein n=1 Tax=Plasmodium vivax TaxID=5855 RepID=A0A8S4HEB6_PLAVI|nr:unnamed protein product [Plasmodium vivax]